MNDLEVALGENARYSGELNWEGARFWWMFSLTFGKTKLGL